MEKTLFSRSDFLKKRKTPFPKNGVFERRPMGGKSYLLGSVIQR